MRRTARALSVAVLASAALGVSAQSGAAAPDAGQDPAGAGGPAAEVSPAGTVPGGTVTVSVTCGPAGGAAPDALDATSQAFDGGTVALLKETGDGAGATGTVYRGTARIASAEDLETDPDAVGPDIPWTVDGTCPSASGDEGRRWSTAMTVNGATGGTGAPAPPAPPAPPGNASAGTVRPGPTCPEPALPGGKPATRGQSAPDPKTAPGDAAVPYEDTASGEEAAPYEEPAPKDAPALAEEPAPGDVPAAEGLVPDDVSEAGEEEGTVPGGEAAPYARPAAPGDSTGHDAPTGHDGPGTHGAPCTTAEPPCPSPATAGKAPCGEARAEHGVRAGAGGAFTDSVPALAAGGLLIAGAFGGAAYRLWLRPRGQARDH
ncbi:hypothetical protein ABZ023_16790 [Streptomyces sp. NPDC006367]|uniref:hypothetical protein n=1 Tax=unclassified Streptomyces TaxID=2593676 RepID=UPI0033B5E36B